MICKECGAYNSDRARFCKVCGASLLAPVAEPEPVVAEENIADAEEETLVEAEAEPVREEEKATTRFVKKSSAASFTDDEEEDDAPVRSGKTRIADRKKKAVAPVDDEDDLDEDEEEEKPSRPQKGLFSKRPAKRAVEEDDEDDDDEDDEEEVKPRRSQKIVSSKRSVKAPADDEEDEDEDEDDDDDEEEVKPSRPQKGLFAKRSNKRPVDDEDDEDDDDDDEEDDEEEVKPFRPQKGLFAKRSNKRPVDDEDDEDDDEDDDDDEEVTYKKAKKPVLAKKRASKDYDDEDDDDEDEDEEEEETADAKVYSSKKNSRAAVSKRRIDDDDDDEDEDDDDEDEDDEYEEYESTPPRSKKRSSGGKSNLLVILLAAIAVILVILIGLVVFCNTKPEYKEKLPSFLQFSSCGGEAEKEEPVPTEQQVELPEEGENDLQTDVAEPEDQVQEYVPEEIDYSAASMEETVNADGVECIKVKFYLQPGETMTAVLPNQDDMVYTNDNENYLDIALEIPKDCYKPNAPLDTPEYVVTPLINIKGVDGNVTSRDVGSFTMTFPEATLEITEPAEIPEDGIMCPQGNVLHITGKTNDHTVTVMANDQKLNVYAGGEIMGDYTLPGEEAEDVVISVSGDNLVSTSKTIKVLPYVFIPETMELSVDGTAKEHKANTKSGKYTLTGKVSPGSDLTATCDYEDVKCGSVLVNADGSFSMEVTFGAKTYGMFAIDLTATQEGYEEGKLTTHVFRMFDDRKAFVNGFNKSKCYTEMPNKKVTFDKIMEDPNAYAAYRFTGKVEAVTEQDGLDIVQVTATVSSKKETKTIYVVNMSSAWDPSKNIGETYKLYTTLNGLYSDGESLCLVGWFAMK